MKIELPTLTQRQRTLRPSFSRWDHFSNRCERLYSLDILFPQPFGSPAQAKGSQIHDLYEMYLRKVREHNYDAKAAFDAMLEAEWPVGPRPPEKLEPYLVTCRDLVISWGSQVKHVEEWINVVDGMPWSGKIDLVIDDPDHGLTVVDWKTCATLTYAKTEREARKSLQLQVYCLALDVRRVGFVYLPNSAQPREVFVTFTDEELELAKVRLRAMKETIEGRWRAAGFELGVDERGMSYLASSPKNVDLSPFAQAGTDMPWCSAKYCSQWANCLGRHDPEVV